MPQSPPVMPVKQVFRVGSAVLLQDKAVILISYEVEKFKFMTSVLYSVLFSEEQPPRFLVFFQSPLLIST